MKTFNQIFISILKKSSIPLKKHHQNKSQNQVYINKAKENIMGENMLLSKNHKMILPELWPTYFSKTKGIYV